MRRSIDYQLLFLCYKVLEAIRDRKNICKNLHLPAQSGNSVVLERMRRGYTRKAYLQLVEHIRDLIPTVSLSSDFICGFCGETEQQFQDTLSLIRTVGYNNAFLFPYSMREVFYLFLLLKEKTFVLFYRKLPHIEDT